MILCDFDLLKSGFCVTSIVSGERKTVKKVKLECMILSQIFLVIKASLKHGTGKVSGTNYSVLAPLICFSPTSPQTLYTALCLAQKINVSVVGIHMRTVITLDLDLHERAVKIRANTGHTNCWVMRMGELHIMFALLRSLGRYIEGSGLDDIWIETGLYGPAVIRQIFGGRHLKRSVEAHLVNLQALSRIYCEVIASDNTEIENLVASISERPCVAVRKQDIGEHYFRDWRYLTAVILDSTLFDIVDSFDCNCKISSFIHETN